MDEYERRYNIIVSTGHFIIADSNNKFPVKLCVQITRENISRAYNPFYIRLAEPLMLIDVPKLLSAHRTAVPYQYLFKTTLIPTIFTAPLVEVDGTIEVTVNIEYHAYQLASMRVDVIPHLQEPNKQRWNFTMPMDIYPITLDNTDNVVYLNRLYTEAVRERLSERHIDVKEIPLIFIPEE